MRATDTSFSRAKGPARPPEVRLIEDDEIIVDCFAGGGGASLGIEWALGRSPDIAINHDPEALAMHRANHPDTEHWCEDIYDVDPIVVCRGRRVGLAWFSPDCTEHSRAKNGAIVRDKKVRGLASSVIIWAAAVRPRVILLENVNEWTQWGPLGEDGRIDPERKGELFEDWCRRLRNLGYQIAVRSLVACDYGAPTSRNRTYVIARCDGIDPNECWPEATHGPGRAEPYRTAAECIDYSIPCPSIFMTAADATAFRKATGIACKRPLVPKTMARIRRGLYKYVLTAAKPFIIPVTHGSTSDTDDRSRGMDDLVPTVTGANRGELAVVQPFVASYYGDSDHPQDRARNTNQPMATQTTERRFAIVQPIAAPFVDTYYGNGFARGSDEQMPTQTTKDRCAVVAPFFAPVKSWGGGGNEPRSPELPHRTITCSKRGEHAIITPTLVRTAHGEETKHGPNKGKRRRGTGAEDIEKPIPTVCASSTDYALLAPTLIQTGYGERPGQKPRCLDLQAPLGTVISGGEGGNGKHAVVTAAFLSMGFSERETGGDTGSRALDGTAGAVTCRDHHNLVVGHMVKFRGTSDGHMDASSFSSDTPIPTISAGGNHIAEVRALLREIQEDLSPEARAGILHVQGATYQMVDIGMRMLEPRELYRAQGFPDSYIIDPVVERTFRRVIKRGKRAGEVVERKVWKRLTETQQVEKCGNSVSPPVACALVRAAMSAQAVRQAA